MKKLYLTLFPLFIFALAHSAQASIILTPPVNDIGLVAHWTFDGKDMLTNVKDTSGGGSNGKLLSFTSTTTGIGKIGQALNFDGGTNYVDTGYTGALGDFSACVWFKNTKNNGNYDRLMEKSYTDGFWIGRNGAAQNSWGGGVAEGASPFGIFVTLQDGVWHQICSIRSGTTHYIYGDGGAVVNSNTVSSSVLSASDLLLGVYTPPNSYFAGSMDDVRVYNRALSATEVAALYKAGQAKTLDVSSLGKNSNVGTGLVGYWTFDAKNMLQNVADSSGSGNNGYLLSGFTSTTTVWGKFGQALSFDGFNDGVSVPNSSSLDLPVKHSISVWVKLNDGSSDQVFVFKGLCGGEWGAYELKVGTADAGGSAGKINYTIRNTNNPGESTVTQTGSPVAGQWTHIVGTHDGTTMRLYINGALDNTAAGDSAAPFIGSSPLELGSDFDCGAGRRYKLNGLLDDVRLYNKTLSDAEVKQLYALGAQKLGVTPTAPTSGGIDGGLVGHWTFDGKNMTRNVADTSGAGNTGYLTSFTSTTTVIGKFGQALKFNGSSNYVTTLCDSSCNFGTGDFSVSVWEKTTSKATAVAVGKFSGTGNDYWLGFTTGQATFSISGGGTVDPTAAGTDGAWHLITGVRSGGTITIYVDGVSENSTSNSSGASPGTPLLIGDFSTGTAYYWDGVLDDARVYNRALSASEVKQLYNMGR